ncbi:MAG: Holliday junction resolvase RuvX [Chloroflexi bacterium]|nr:Holliday junction resolvase RuvX [Chloroflexota bacterium]
MPRNLGLDIGDRRIGVAMSDPSYTLATPLKTIIRMDDEKAIEEIVGLVKKYDIEKIIMGLPYSLDGTIGKQAEKVLLFKEKLAQKSSAVVLMQDERLSSVSANQKLREAGKKKDKLKKEMDAAAATIILQDYLDTMKLSS